MSDSPIFSPFTPICSGTRIPHVFPHSVAELSDFVYHRTLIFYCSVRKDYKCEYVLSQVGKRIFTRMKFAYIAGMLVGAFIAFLGILWFLQGTGILHIRPIVCVADCEEIVGTSPSWAIAGAVALILGVLIAVVSARRFRTPQDQADEPINVQ